MSFANVNFRVEDRSVSTANTIQGLTAVMGITERGPLATPVLVRSWIEFENIFGGYITASMFPLYCKRALDAGCPLMVSRIAHYTTISDPSSAVGTKSSGTITAATNSITVTAKSIGLWGNKVAVNIIAPVSGLSGKVDITVTLAGYPALTQTVRNVNTALTTAELATLNASLSLVNFGSPTNAVPVGSVTLTSGAENYNDVVAADYAGNQTAGTGIYAFDDVQDIVRIAVPELADSEVDVALKNYAENRKDLTAILRTPIGITGVQAVAYRNKTGSYSAGTKIDSPWASLYFGGLKVTDPLSSNTVTVSCIGDVLGALATRDRVYFPWLAVGGSARGQIFDIVGLDYDLGSVARRNEADTVTLNGVNPVVGMANGKFSIFGNYSLQVANTLLNKANVVELIVAINRALRPLLESELFEPNDIVTWRTIYRKVSAYMDSVVTNRGVFSYRYVGDQDVDAIEDATINNATDVAAGKYKFLLYLEPIAGLEEISVTAVVTTAGLSLEIID